MTNGFDIDSVVTALSRIGWKNPTEKGYDKVDDTNQLSDSGRFFNDGSFDAILSVQNIYDCMDDAKRDDCEFNDFLKQLVKSNILKMVNMVFGQPVYVDSGVVYTKWASTQNNKVKNNGKFVGIRICIADGNYGVTLKNAILYFDAEKTFDLYLYHTLTNGVEVDGETVTEVAYQKKWSVTSKANSQKVVALNYDISNNTDLIKGGEFLLGYFQDDLDDVQAIDYSPNLNRFRAVGVDGMETTVKEHSSQSIDLENYNISTGMYGLNLELTSYKSYTSLIVNNAHLFDNLQGLLMTESVIDLILKSARSNTRERLGAERIKMLYMQQNNVTTRDNPLQSGLWQQIQKEVQQIRDSINHKPKAQVLPPC